MKKIKFHPALLPTLALLAAAMFSSCAIPRVVSEEGDDYPGLASQLGGKAKSNKTLHVVVTHGMRHISGDLKGFCEFEELALAMLEEKLGAVPVLTKDGPPLTLAKDAAAIKVLNDTADADRFPGVFNNYLKTSKNHEIYHVRNYEWEGRDDLKDIRFHWIAYSWYLNWLKARMAWYDENHLWSKSDYLVNRTLKREIMNRGFPDAVSYLDTNHRIIVQDHFLRCFDRIASGGMKPDEQVAFVSSSLGSKVLLDSLETAAGSGSRSQHRASRETLAGNTSHFFMFANQIPLLDLGTVDDSLNSLINFRANAASSTRRAGVPHELTIVDFSDPSDILTYHLDREKYQTVGNLKLKIANVEVRNGGIAIWPILRDPSSAHNNYRSNAQVMQRIILGHPQSP